MSNKHLEQFLPQNHKVAVQQHQEKSMEVWKMLNRARGIHDKSEQTLKVIYTCVIDDGHSRAFMLGNSMNSLKWDIFHLG